MIDVWWVGSAVAVLSGSIFVFLIWMGLRPFLTYHRRLDEKDEEELYDMAQSGTLPEDFDKTK